MIQDLRFVVRMLLKQKGSLWWQCFRCRWTSVRQRRSLVLRMPCCCVLRR